MLIETNQSLSEMDRFFEKWIEEFYSDYSYVSGRAGDLYWDSPVTSKADFIRLRRTTTRGAQITVKETDKTTNVDRVEIDMDVDDYDKAHLMLQALFGDHRDKVIKRYAVYVLENNDTTISLYQVMGCHRIFIEMEARTPRRVEEMTQEMLKHVDVDSVKWVLSSVKDMYVSKKDPILRPVMNFFEVNNV